MMKGDIDKDGLVTDKDVWLLQQAIADKFKLSASELRAADMDGDGKPTMQDVVDLQRLLAKMLPGDVNGDGMVDIKDAQILKKELLKLLRLDVEGGADQISITDAALLQKLIDGIIASYLASQPKRNKLTIELKEFETGEYLSWFVTSQAANKVTVTLRDDKTQYFSESKDTTNIEPPLAVGSNRYVGKNLVLEISIPQSDEIRPLPAMHPIISDTGKVLGHSFTCCGEDWSDNDYNDFYINLVGWKSKK